MLNLPVHGPHSPEPAPPLLQAAPVHRKPLGPNPHYLLIAVRQADTFLRGRGTSLEAATRADLEAFIGEQLDQELLPVAPAVLREGRGTDADRTAQLAHQVGWPAWPVPRDP